MSGEQETRMPDAAIPKSTPKTDALMYLGHAQGLAGKKTGLSPVEWVQLRSFLEMAVESVTAIDERTRKRSAAKKTTVTL